MKFSTQVELEGKTATGMEVPDDLAAALDADAEAAETRQRRIDKTVAMLAEGRDR